MTTEVYKGDWKCGIAPHFVIYQNATINQICRSEYMPNNVSQEEHKLYLERELKREYTLNNLKSYPDNIQRVVYMEDLRRGMCPNVVIVRSIMAYKNNPKIENLAALFSMKKFKMYLETSTGDRIPIGKHSFRSLHNGLFHETIRAKI